jgi:hypothetical protein
MIKAPYTKDQVKRLNQYQSNGYFHPFTCGGKDCRETLIATNDGFICPHCGYKQDWAHEFMFLEQNDIFGMAESQQNKA